LEEQIFNQFLTSLDFLFRANYLILAGLPGFITERKGLLRIWLERRRRAGLIPSWLNPLEVTLRLKKKPRLKGIFRIFKKQGYLGSFQLRLEKNW